MGTTPLPAELIYPSNNDINGGVSGQGKNLSEIQFALLQQSIRSLNHFVSVPSVTLTGGLGVTIGAGSAVINGHYVSWSSQAITLPDNTVSHVYVQLTFTSGLSTGAQLVDTTANNLADSVKIHVITASGGSLSISAVTTTLRRTSFDTPLWADFQTNATIRIFSPWYLFEVWGASGGGGGGGGGNIGDSGTLYGSSGGRGGRGGPGGYWRSGAGPSQNHQGNTYTLVIGAGGTAGSGGGVGAAGGNGGAGGTTSIAELGVSLPGGGGGLGGSPGTQNLSSASGAINVGARAGQDGGYAAVSPGVIWPVQGGMPGVGGVGAADSSAGVGGAGTAGKPGYIRIWY